MEMLGVLLKKIRKEKGLTLEQLAALTDISKSYLSQIESNKKKPSAVYLHRISGVLGVPYSFLIEHSKGTNFLEKYNLEQIEKGHFENVISRIVPIDLKHLSQLESATDFNNLLGSDVEESILTPSLNGHFLTKEESERALAMLYILFPHYKEPK